MTIKLWKKRRADTNSRRRTHPPPSPVLWGDRERWRNSQVRGFHFPASTATEEHAAFSSFDSDGAGNGNKQGLEGPQGCAGDQALERDSAPTPPPVVWPSPVFTRDMQVSRGGGHHDNTSLEHNAKPFSIVVFTRDLMPCSCLFGDASDQISI